jgi:hypothetical protein
MKSRSLASLLTASWLAALCVASCIDGSSGDYGPSGSGEGRAHCERFTSCATCTPVLGCGWCQSGGKGMCTSEPNRCDDAQSFSWTWELAYCPAEPDAGGGGWVAVPPSGSATDGGAPKSDSAAPTADTGVPSADAPTDSGVPGVDAGTPISDSGPPGIDALAEAAGDAAADAPQE